jgi:prepilin-type N-terminal cleavage/methylation domain-containing protein
MEKERGFTLIEVLVTMALFALLMTMVSSSIINALRFQRQGIERARLKEKAQEILKIISTELMASNEPGNVITNIYPSPSSAITFTTTNLNAYVSDPSTGGDVNISYRLTTGTGTLWRTECTTAMSVMNVTLVADNVKDLQFKSEDPDQWLIDIDITVVTDITDPGSTSYRLLTSVCRRGTRDQFGP